MTVATTINVPDEPQAVALSRVVDDTIFITDRGSANSISTLDAQTLGSPAQTSLGIQPAPTDSPLVERMTAYITSYTGNRRIDSNWTAKRKRLCDDRADP